jgi:hypothetical protein
MNRQQHRPQPEFQPVPRHDKSAEQRAENEGDQPGGVVNETDLRRRQPSPPARADRAEKAGTFSQLRLAQPVKQQKQQQRDDFRLPKKSRERDLKNSVKNLPGESSRLGGQPPAAAK